MNDSEVKFKIHIKNNRWKEGSFPNTPEGEKVFTITNEHLIKKNNEISLKEQNLTKTLNIAKQKIEKIIDNIKKSK